MAEGKRPARRVNRPAQEEAADGKGGTYGVLTVGEITRSIEQHAIHDVAFTKTVTVSDRTYTAEEAEQISRLRHERWGLLGIFAMASNMVRTDPLKYKELKRRHDLVQAQLYQITQNEIYNVEGKIPPSVV